MGEESLDNCLLQCFWVDVHEDITWEEVADESVGAWGELIMNSFNNHSAAQNAGCTGIESIEH
jgi:hypothetical protein